MSSDQSGLAVKLVRRDAESCVLTLTGELSLRSAGTVCGAVTKALLEVDRVLIDVSRLRLTWTPAAQVFPSTLAVMGGWPWARLVLFGADAGLATSLNELGVTTAVPLAADEPEARQLVERRPPTVSRYLDLEKALSSAVRARLFVGAACTDWQLDALRDDAVIVSSELVANAVLHARTECRLTVRAGRARPHHRRARSPARLDKAAAVDRRDEPTGPGTLRGRPAESVLGNRPDR